MHGPDFLIYLEIICLPYFVFTDKKTKKDPNLAAKRQEVRNEIPCIVQLNILGNTDKIFPDRCFNVIKQIFLQHLQLLSKLAELG